MSPRRRRVTSKPVDYTEHKLEKLPERPSPKKRPSPSPTPVMEEHVSDSFPHNYQPKAERFSYQLDLDGAYVTGKTRLVLRSGQVIKKDDSIYLICEPPGEPYYVGRIMGFVRKAGIATPAADVKKEPAEHFSFKINWWYRSRDISKHSPDSRLLYASMHSDLCPLQSYRGTCLVKHKDEIEDLDVYKQTPNQFWFEKLFDRYMIKFYDVLPTQSLAHLPPNYQKALNKRYQYIFVELGKSKEMLQRPKNCVKCNQWCVPSDSIQCCECDDYYHMLCLDPPLFKKPARGFAWSCISCTKKLEEKKMATEFARLGAKPEELDDVVMEDASTQPTNTTSTAPLKLPLYEEIAIQFLEKDKALTIQQRRDQEEWTYRYLGMHAKLEDALDLEDRPYPRAASRLGTKHQFADMQPWFDHNVVYYDTTELAEEFRPVAKKPKAKPKGKGKSTAVEEETLTPLPLPEEFKDKDPEEFPPWLQPRPKGYIERGGDDTVTLMWKNPGPEVLTEEKLDEYVAQCAPFAEKLDLLANTPNFMDAILKNLMDSEYNTEKAMELNKKITRASLKEPTFTPQEIKKFENGIRKYGSELWPTFKEVKTQSFAMIVRFYYLWKKTPKGHQIWDNFDGRKKNMKVSNDTEDEQSLANANDDSSFDIKTSKKRKFQCKHCKTNESVQWFRVSGQKYLEDDPTVHVALCMRCARLWRRYAVHWEDPVEVLKKYNVKGGSSWKKRLEMELVEDAELIIKMKKSLGESDSKESSATPVQRKRQKVEAEDTKKTEEKPQKKKTTPVAEVKKEKKPKEEILVSTIISDTSQYYPLNQQIIERLYQLTSTSYNTRLKFKEVTPPPQLHHPLHTGIVDEHCVVCRDSMGVTPCASCGISTHATCYGLVDPMPKTWYCDQCCNTHSPLISLDYTCVICDEKDARGMKRLKDGRWAHVSCVLLDEGATVNGKLIQPITLDPSKSSACHELKCDACSKELKKKDALLRFKIVMDDKMDIRGIKVSNSQSGKLKLVAVCEEHQEGFIPFYQDVKRFRYGSINSLQLYFEEYKKNKDPWITGCQGAFKELSDAKGVKTEVTESKKDEKSCSSCHKTWTLKWMDDGLCYECYLLKQDEDVDMDGTSTKLAELVKLPVPCSAGYGIKSGSDKLPRRPVPQYDPWTVESSLVVQQEVFPLPPMAVFPTQRKPTQIIPPLSPPQQRQVVQQMSASQPPPQQQQTGLAPAESAGFTALVQQQQQQQQQQSPPSQQPPQLAPLAPSASQEAPTPSTEVANISTTVNPQLPPIQPQPNTTSGTPSSTASTQRISPFGQILKEEMLKPKLPPILSAASQALLKEEEKPENKMSIGSILD